MSAQERLVDIATRVLEHARPGEQVEVYASRGSSTSVRAYNGEIEAFTDEIDDAPAERDLDARLRMSAYETRDDRRERPDAEVDGGRDAHGPAHLCLGIRRGRRGPFDVAERTRDTLEEGGARVGEMELPRRAMEQPDTEILLELRDTSADRRLRQAE